MEAKWPNVITRIGSALSVTETIWIPYLRKGPPTAENDTVAAIPLSNTASLKKTPYL